MGETMKLFTDEHAERMKENAGKPYRPANGTEGMMFEDAWCDGCAKRLDDWELGGGCSILDASMLFDAEEEGYPKELRIGTNGQPECTARRVKE
jgi:hypothetical protein